MYLKFMTTSLKESLVILTQSFQGYEKQNTKM